MHRPGRRIDFSARRENIIRIIQSNESRAGLDSSGCFFFFSFSLFLLPIPPFPHRHIVEHGRFYHRCNPPRRLHFRYLLTGSLFRVTRRINRPRVPYTVYRRSRGVFPRLPLRWFLLLSRMQTRCIRRQTVALFHGKNVEVYIYIEELRKTSASTICWNRRRIRCKMSDRGCIAKERRKVKRKREREREGGDMDESAKEEKREQSGRGWGRKG